MIEEAALELVPRRRDDASPPEERIGRGLAIGVVGPVRIVERERRAGRPLTQIDEPAVRAADEREAARKPVDPIVAREQLQAVLAITYGTLLDELP
jgi:hypothetical protein